MKFPMVNVNRERCTCGYHVAHAEHCRGAPILVPCAPPQPAAFRFAVGTCPTRRPGERCEPAEEDGERCRHGAHARESIAVRFSLKGSSWHALKPTGMHFGTGASPAPSEAARLKALARERWALVEALMLGFANISHMLTGPCATELLSERDAVFGKVAAMARAEQAHHARSVELFNVLRRMDPQGGHVEGPAAYAMAWSEHSEDSNSALGLRAYLEILMEKVATL